MINFNTKIAINEIITYLGRKVYKYYHNFSVKKKLKTNKIRQVIYVLFECLKYETSKKIKKYIRLIYI